MIITPRDQLDEERFRALTNRFEVLRARVELLPGNGATIHKRMTLVGRIAMRLECIGRRGEYSFIGELTGTHLIFTLDEVEEMLEKEEGK